MEAGIPRRDLPVPAGIQKIRPRQKKLCQGRNTFRGATLFHDVVLFARYYHISGMLTPALRCGILCQSFRRTLSGPFGRLPFHPFSPGRTLFGRISCFDLRINGFLIRRLYPLMLFVKGKNIFLLRIRNPDRGFSLFIMMDAQDFRCEIGEYLPVFFQKKEVGQYLFRPLFTGGKGADAWRVGKDIFQ